MFSVVAIDEAYRCLYSLDKTFDYTGIKIRIVSSPPYGVILEGEKPIILYPSDPSHVEDFKAIFEKTKWYIVLPKQLDKIVEQVKGKDIVIDIETNQLEIYKGNPKVIAVGIAINGTDESWAIPTEEPFVDPETKKKNVDFIKKIIENAAGLITHNGTRFDIPFIAKAFNLDVFKLFVKHKADTLIMAHVLTGGGLKDYSLGTLARIYVDNSLVWKDEVKDYLAQTERLVKNRTYDKVPIDLLLPYCRLDVYYTNKLYDILSPALNKEMKKPFHLVQKEIGYLCLRMFTDGLFLDYNNIAYMKERIAVKKEESDILARHYLDRIFKQRGIEKSAETTNFNSSKQMGQIYFKDMGLPVMKKSKKTTEPSSDNETLSMLLPFEPSLILCQLLSQKWSTVGGYLESYTEVAGNSIVSDAPLCCHSQFNPTGTVTGRLASSKPNAQNITEEAQLKAAFCSPDRSKIIWDMRKKMEECVKKEK